MAAASVLSPEFPSTEYGNFLSKLPAWAIGKKYGGGGISGLCLAAALSKYSHIDVNIYEATEIFKEIGAGVMIWSRTWAILQQLGLAEQFSEIAHAPPDKKIGVGFDYRRSDQPNEGFSFRLFELPYGCIRFHRAAFLDVLVNALPDSVAHFGKRLVSYAKDINTSEYTLTFSDASTASCDLLVGCDGIKSTVRAQMFQAKAQEDNNPDLKKHIDPVWTGTIAFRGLIPANEVPKNTDGSLHRTIGSPMMYCGKGRHVVSYSIARGSVVNVVTFVSEPTKHGAAYPETWVKKCKPDDLWDAYSGWEPEVIALLKDPTHWGIHQLQPLPFYYQDRVVLVGDSAHAMSPHQGAGAGVAIEDTFILAILLGKGTKDTLPEVLDTYQKVRLPFANRVLEGSYQSGMMYEFNSSFGDDYAVLGPMIEKQWNWLQEMTPEEEAQKALETFMALTGLHERGSIKNS